ncbi:hypothetical protein [Pseudomonas sp. 2FE]|uniref:hypothetical protein n=1 Tax=Pseudomonas sp. 2FE TaxID=2502190 RepID=UPI0010F50F8A|nr:hypothetical protein [Pseudomonas sp. 2FE]
MSRKQYGNLPLRPSYTAKIQGDSGVYDVWGIDWYNERVQVYRAPVLEWVPISQVNLEQLPQDPVHLPQLLTDLRAQVAADIESPSTFEPDYSRDARELVARIDALLVGGSDEL